MRIKNGQKLKTIQPQKNKPYAISSDQKVYTLEEHY